MCLAACPGSMCFEDAKSGHSAQKLGCPRRILPRDLGPRLGVHLLEGSKDFENRSKKLWVPVGFVLHLRAWPQGAQTMGNCRLKCLAFFLTKILGFTGAIC